MIMSPFSDRDETGDDDCRRHGSQDKAQHETHCDGEAHDEVGQSRYRCCLHKAGYEGGSENHATEVPKSHRIHLQTCPDQDDGQTESSQLSSNVGIQLVTNILWLAVMVAVIASSGHIIRNRDASLVPCLDNLLYLHHLQKIVRDAPLEWAVLFYRVIIMDAVTKCCIVAVGGTLGPTKLAKIVGNILENYSNK